MIHGIYQRNDFWERERRKIRDKKLLDGITAYAFQQLMKGNKEKALRAANVALGLEVKLDK